MLPTLDLAENQIETAASLIRHGKLVVFPTETVFGLGANARDPRAVAQIFLAKGRPQDNPLIVHIASLAALSAVAINIGPLARSLMEYFCPGPLTVILTRHPDLAPAVTAGLGTVGVRIPESAIARDFLAACAVPVAAPSANRSGRPSPTSFAMAWAEMAGRADAILRGPDAAVGLESTIVWPQDEKTLHVLRPGGINPQHLLDFIKNSGLAGVSLHLPGQDGRLNGEDLPRSPGTRHRHYSPTAQVHLFSSSGELAQFCAQDNFDPGDCAWLGLAGFSALGPEIGSCLGKMRLVRQFATIPEYAQGLYRGLVDADKGGCRHILAWLPDQSDDTLALRDRLLRAAGQTD